MVTRGEAVRRQEGKGRGGGKSPARFALASTPEDAWQVPAAEPVPYAGRSRGKVLPWLAAHPWSTTQQAADGAGVSWATARRTLQSLAAGGTCVTRKQQPGEIAGPPAVLYALAESSQSPAA